MKKTIGTLMLLISLASAAQTNLQLHYDFGKGRNYITSTLEMFKQDDWGNTFFFVDIDYNSPVDKHPSLGYMEIARCITLGKSALSAQIEYNGGLFTTDGNQYLPINNAWLAGIDYGWNDKSFSKFLNIKLLYKYIQAKHPASFQITGVWNLNFYNNKLTLSGYADFWRENNENFMNASGDAITPTITNYVFMTEPQIWYNATKHFSVGGEIELAANFAAVKGLKACPTLGLKWNF